MLHGSSGWSTLLWSHAVPVVSELKGMLLFNDYAEIGFGSIITGNFKLFECQVQMYGTHALTYINYLLQLVLS